VTEAPGPDIDSFSRRRIWWEVTLVLAVSLGQSAVYAIVSLADSLTRSTPLSHQTATLNPSLSNREVFDLIYQLLALVFDVVPVVLVCYLLGQRWQGQIRELMDAQPEGFGSKLLLPVLALAE